MDQEQVMRFLCVSRIAVALVSIGVADLAVAALAANFDPIAARRALMKQDGQNAKMLVDMQTGATPFDGAKAAKAATAMSKLGHTFLTEFDKYFPDSSKSGDTKAAPALWDNKDDVKKLFASLEADAKVLADAAASGGGDAFKGAFEKLGGDCKDCHEKYKLK
jgi:cytochrome c556